MSKTFKIFDKIQNFPKISKTFKIFHDFKKFRKISKISYKISNISKLITKNIYYYIIKGLLHKYW
jgi:hypothetical protein